MTSGLTTLRGEGEERSRCWLMVTEDDIRRIALSLPASTEKPSYGTPGFRVKDRLVARIREDRELLVRCCDVEEKKALIDSEPDKFFTTPHYDGHPTVLVKRDAIDLAELAELLSESWRLRAPKRLVADFDASRGSANHQ